jgi:hypothetical protein
MTYFNWPSFLKSRRLFFRFDEKERQGSHASFESAEIIACGILVRTELGARRAFAKVASEGIF